MTPKERLLAALHGRPLERMAAVYTYPLFYVEEATRGVALAEYKALIGGREEINLDPVQEARIQAQAARAGWCALGETPDWIWPPELPPAAWLADCALRQEGGRLWRIHRPSGGREDLCASVAENPHVSDLWERVLPRSRAEVDDLIPVQTADELLADGSLAAISLVRQEMGQQVFVCGFLNGSFWSLYSLLGFHGLMTMPRSHPELFHCMSQRRTQAALARARAYAQVGVHGIFVEECLTSADLISPQVYDEFVFPYDQQLFSELRSLGLESVLYFCGEVVPRLPRLVELAPTALAVEESKKNFRVELAEVAQAVGKCMALFGNLDPVHVRIWDDEELEAALIEQCRAAEPARGFIPGVGSPFTPDTPRERIAAFLRTVWRLSWSRTTRGGPGETQRVPGAADAPLSERNLSTRPRRPLLRHHGHSRYGRST